MKRLVDSSTRSTSVLMALLLLVVPVTPVMAQVEPEPSIETPDDAREHGLESLRKAVENDGGVPIPSLNRWVRDRDALLKLGKALFFEMAAGSDGVQACATCHFHAGADNRVKNQLSPDLLRVKDRRQGDIKGFHFADAMPDTLFEVATGAPSTTGPNDTLVPNDFPFVRDIGNGDNVVESADGTVSPAPGNSNDVASSQGVFLTEFTGVEPGAAIDQGVPQDDPVFRVGPHTVRRVEPRNTPTVINAVFNFTNFWDGRANPRFNGVSPFGRQDRDARIFVASSNGSVSPVRISLRNSSLASQAVGPPLSDFEMSFAGRSFPDLGRKLIPRRPLDSQRVDPDDSVFGPCSDTFEGEHCCIDPSGIGLKGTYRELIEQAFTTRLWDSDAEIFIPGGSVGSYGQVAGDSSGARVIDPVDTKAGSSSDDIFSLMEANFSFFWGISIMVYEATLVSDDSPFDQWMEHGGSVEGFGDRELKGLNVFVGNGKCVNCHGGPELTNASVRNAQRGNNMIEPMLMGDRRPAFYDNGFYNIGVTPTVDDVGRGGCDPFGDGSDPDRHCQGKPLSFSRQFVFRAFGVENIPFNIIGAPIPNLQCQPTSSGPDCSVLGFEDEDFGLGFIPVCNDLTGDGRCGARNDEILIERVAVDGAFKTPGLRNIELQGPYFHNGSHATLREVVEFYDRGGNFCRFNCADLDPDIRQLGLTDDEKDALVAFMVSLTDKRVVVKAAPFDGPELFVPNGHPGDENATLGNPAQPNQALDDFLQVPATGRFGGPPIGTFLNLDPNAMNPVTGDQDEGGDVRCSPNFEQCERCSDPETAAEVCQEQATPTGFEVGG